MLEEIANRKAEAAKKTKAKPKTEEEEAEELEQLKKIIVKEIGQKIYGSEGQCIINGALDELQLQKTRDQMDNHIVMDEEIYDKLNRKLSVYDVELGSRDVILRLDLDIPLSKFIPPEKIQDLGSLKSAEHKAGPSVGGESKIRDRMSDVNSVVSHSPLGEEVEYWKQRNILDHSWVKQTVAELKMIMEK